LVEKRQFSKPPFHVNCTITYNPFEFFPQNFNIQTVRAERVSGAGLKFTLDPSGALSDSVSGAGEGTSGNRAGPYQSKPSRHQICGKHANSALPRISKPGFGVWQMINQN